MEAWSSQGRSSGVEGKDGAVLVAVDGLLTFEMPQKRKRSWSIDEE